MAILVRTFRKAQPSRRSTLTSLHAASLVSLPIALGCSASPQTPAQYVVPITTPSSLSQSIAASPSLRELDLKSVSAAESWRVEFGSALPIRVATLPDAGCVVALAYSSEVTLAGHTYSNTGEYDILLVGISSMGQVAWATPLGSVGDDEIKDLVVSKDRIFLAVRVNGPLTVANQPLTPRKRTPGDILDVPALTGIATYSISGKPLGVQPLPDNPREVALGVIDQGDLIVASSFTGKNELLGHAVVQRRSLDGNVRWTQQFPGVEVHDVASLSKETILSMRATGRLSASALDTETGALTPKLELEKPAGVGDLGTLAGVGFDQGGAMVALGETGDDVSVGGRSFDRPSYAIQPFALRGRDTTTQFLDGPDVTGRFIGLGSIRTHPVGVLEVIHPGKKDPGVHRGVYMAFVEDTSLRLIPVFQERFRNDDWEHEPAETVFGKPIFPREAAFSGDGVVIVGRCDAEKRTNCLVRIDLH